MKSITIQLTKENELSVTASDAMSPLEVTDLTLSALLAMYNSILYDAPQDLKEELKEFLFQMFNVSASALLAQFAPEIELRPDLTEEAIFIKELELANDKLQVSDM